MEITDLRKLLVNKNLKVTPQRLAVLDALYTLDTHPTAEQVIDFIKINHPNIAVGTVYNILDTLVESSIIRKVKTERDIMRYDAIPGNHHHLYCAESDRIEDYFDNELNEVLVRYFEKKSIPGFRIEEIKLQIIGQFKSKTSR